MTETGKAILKEYQSEIEERIEDDKNLILNDQLTNIFTGFWRFAITFVNAFFVNVVVVGTFILVIIDASMIEAYRAASNEDIVGGIKVFFSIVGIIQICIIFIFGVFYYRRYFQDKKQERIDYEAQEERLRALIIEFSEEVLSRHGLIKKGVHNEQ